METFFVNKPFMFKGEEVTVKGETDSGNLLVVNKDGKEQWTTHEKVMPIFDLAA